MNLSGIMVELCVTTDAEGFHPIGKETLGLLRQPSEGIGVARTIQSQPREKT